MGPFYIMTKFHYPPYVFGLFQVLIFGFFIYSNWLVKKMMEKLGIQQLISFGLGMSLFGGLIASIAAYGLPQFLSGLLLGLSLYSFGFGFCGAPLQRLIIEASSVPMGSRMALLSTSLGLFGWLATVLAKLYYHGNLSDLAVVLFFTALLASLSYGLGKASKKAH
jgi:DHA1 family multidrug/chloramphenicol efflux transport protein-like MFS transporter